MSAFAIIVSMKKFTETAEGCAWRSFLRSRLVFSSLSDKSECCSYSSTDWIYRSIIKTHSVSIVICMPLQICTLCEQISQSSKTKVKVSLAISIFTKTLKFSTASFALENHWNQSAYISIQQFDSAEDVVRLFIFTVAD